MDPVFATTMQLAAAIRAREISAREVLEAHLAHIEQHNPALNAIITLDAEGARERARQADQALDRGEVWGALHGVPFTLKDAHATAGMRTTVGFPPLADYAPPEDGTVAARLKAAGGILMGKTNVAMLLGDALQTENPIFGRTNNPWDTTRSPGGSSGGAAAAVAAGLTPFEVGTDLAGSIRIPAHFCGLFGLKPTEHRVPLTGVVPDPRGLPRAIRLMSCVGPLARSIDDLALIYQIIAGPDGRDTEVPPVPVQGAAELELTGLRIAAAPAFAGFPVSAEIRQAVEALAGELSRLGAVVEQAPLPTLDFQSDGAHLGELIGMMLGAFDPQSTTTLAQYLTALHQRDQSISAWERFFEQWDALLCPVSMTGAFSHRDVGAPISIDGRELPYWLGNAHCAVFNYSGHPALTLPYTVGSEGLPIGLQLVGKRWSESRLLGIADAITRMTDGFRPPQAYLKGVQHES